MSNPMHLQSYSALLYPCTQPGCKHFFKTTGGHTKHLHAAHPQSTLQFILRQASESCAPVLVCLMRKINLSPTYATIYSQMLHSRILQHPRLMGTTHHQTSRPHLKIPLTTMMNGIPSIFLCQTLKDTMFRTRQSFLALVTSYIDNIIPS